MKRNILIWALYALLIARPFELVVQLASRANLRFLLKEDGIVE